MRLAAVLACAFALVGLLAGRAALRAFDADPVVGVIRQQGSARIDALVRVVAEPRASPGWGGEERWSAQVRIERAAPAGGRVPPVRTRTAPRALVVGSGWGDVAVGDLVRARGEVDSTFLGEPPGVGVLRADSPRLADRPGGWRGAVRALRSGLVRACRGLDAQGRALVPGMAVGDDSAMAPDLEESLRTASLGHLTAVSGSHVAILAGVVAVAVPGGRRVRAVTTTAVMVALVAVVGPEPSVLRSVGAGAVGVCAMLLGRSGQGVAALAGVGCAMLLGDPWSARSPGFALSMAATAGVIGPGRRWSERWGAAWRERVGEGAAGRLARWCAPAVAMPLAAQLCVAPLAVLLSPWLPTWGIPANVASAPAVAPATLLGLGAAVLAVWAPGPAAALAGGAALFTGWIARVGGAVAGWPLARIAWPEGVGGGLLLALSLALAAGGLALRARWRAAGP